MLMAEIHNAKLSVFELQESRRTSSQELKDGTGSQTWQPDFYLLFTKIIKTLLPESLSFSYFHVKIFMSSDKHASILTITIVTLLLGV